MDFLKKLAKLHRGTGAEHRIKPVLDKLNAAILKSRISADAIVGGSVAKGTYLPKFDCDIFVRFDMKYVDKSISDLLEKILSVFPKVERVHGSRDYFKFVSSGVEYEIIPVLHIDNAESAHNVTDVSPLHVTWVKKHINGMGDDVVLAKLFCKAQGTYGAESYINGFSGYMLEILVIHYGGFIGFLQGISKWKPKHVIDHSKFYANHEDVFSKMNKAKIESPLILIDPVQKDRNAASALSHENFAKMILAAKNYLSSPSVSYFKKVEFSLALIKKKAKECSGELVLVELSLETGKRDVVGSKIVKCFEHLRSELEKNEFKIIDCGWHWEKKALLWYIAYPKELPKLRSHQGPMVYSSTEDIKRFMDKHKSCRVENYRMICNVKRKFSTPKTLIKSLVKEEYFTDKVKKARLLK
ncbi:MAG: CCA tRNA nucleotidyltransferase [Candidatus Woesearchaeota archaeon]